MSNVLSIQNLDVQLDLQDVMYKDVVDRYSYNRKTQKQIINKPPNQHHQKLTTISEKMCETKHRFYFCACKNPQCTIRSVTCVEGHRPPIEQVRRKPGHFMAECDYNRDYCTNFVFDFLDPKHKRSDPVVSCPDDEKSDVAVAMPELCRLCKASCALKQWGQWTSKRGIDERRELLTMK